MTLLRPTLEKKAHCPSLAPCLATLSLTPLLIRTSWLLGSSSSPLLPLPPVGFHAQSLQVADGGQNLKAFCSETDTVYKCPPAPKCGAVRHFHHIMPTYPMPCVYCGPFRYEAQGGLYSPYRAPPL